jgi:hypothetical protein
MKKNYNFTRRKLYMPEYGRHIHQMVDSLLEIEDRQERTRQAKAVIAVMGNLNPTLRDTEDFKHKLWDHLFIMSDFKLDVDSPYQQPSRQDLTLRPQKLAYPQSRITFKYYGKYTQRFVRHIAEEHNSARATSELANIARFMRTKSYEYNDEHPNNDSILRDIHTMAGSDLEMDLSVITSMHSEYRHGTPARPQRRGKMQHNNGRRAHTQHNHLHKNHKPQRSGAHKQQ